MAKLVNGKLGKIVSNVWMGRGGMLNHQGREFGHVVEMVKPLSGAK